MDWFFDGLGTMLLGLVIGGAVGHVGTRIWMGNKIKQRQKAGDNATQTQVGGNLTEGD